jgi:hypothetical protein
MPSLTPKIKKSAKPLASQDLVSAAGPYVCLSTANGSRRKLAEVIKIAVKSKPGLHHFPIL